MVSILGRERERIVALIDVRRGSASVTFVTVSGTGPARIVASGRSTVTLEKRDAAQTAVTVKQHIEEAGAAALSAYGMREQHPAVHTVYVVLHAPLSRSEIVRAEASYETPTKVTRQRMTDIARTAFDARKDIDPAHLIETEMQAIKLNGYLTTRPEGKQASTIEIASILSDIDPSYRVAIEGAVQSLFPVAEIAWRSAMRTLLKSLEQARPLAQQYVALDMGLDETHVFSVRDGEVHDQRIVLEGIRTILERIAPGKFPDETLGLMRMMGRDACEGSACETVQEAIAKAEPDLARLFGDALGSMASVRHVPNQLIVLAHSDILPWLSTFLTRIDFAQFTVTALPFTVVNPAAEDLERLVAADPGLDMGIVFGAALVNIESRS